MDDRKRGAVYGSPGRTCPSRRRAPIQHQRQTPSDGRLEIDPRHANILDG